MVKAVEDEVGKTVKLGGGQALDFSSVRGAFTVARPNVDAKPTFIELEK
jgi:hypothetical protein